MCFRLLGEEEAKQGIQKLFAAPFGIVNKLEESEIKGEFFLGDAAMRPQPRA